MSSSNPSWWHQSPIVDPLTAVRVTAECLEAGQPVPQPEARLIAKALRSYLEGHRDITASLGLRPRTGGRYEDPLVLERNRERDTHIRAAFACHPGQTQTAKAEGVAELLRAPELPREITEQAVFGYVLRLRRDFPDQLPTSGRQVLRIAQGDTLTARRKT